VDDDHSEVQVDLRGHRLSVDALTEAIEALTTVRDEMRRLDG
jgi:hypothetical protein